MTIGQWLVYWLWTQTLSNNLAWLEAIVITVIATWLFRDHIGKKAAAWWAKHHGPHAIEQHREALRQHEEGKASGS